MAEAIKTAQRALSANYSTFVENLSNPLDVVDYLCGPFDPPVLTSGMLEAIKAESKATNQTKAMLRELSKCGPQVPLYLYEALMETGNQNLALCLVQFINMMNKDSSQCALSEWPPNYFELRKMKSDKVHHLKPTDPLVHAYINNTEVYHMTSYYRGTLLIINNIQFSNEIEPKLLIRHGSREDAHNLSNVFTQLHFQVCLKSNLSSDSILAEAEALATSVSETDCCVAIAIFSHGCKNGVYGIDNKVVNFDEVRSKFYPNKCPAMAEKPKLFFIQACRGKQQQQSRSYAGKCDQDGCNTDSGFLQSSNALEFVPTEDQTHPHFLTAYSTPEGAVSWRDEKSGSWFILAIVWVLKYHSHELSLMEMLTKVNNYVSKGRTKGNKVTVSNYRSTLQKSLYFFPGIQYISDQPKEHSVLNL